MEKAPLSTSLVRQRPPKIGRPYSMILILLVVATLYWLSASLGGLRLIATDTQSSQPHDTLCTSKTSPYGSFPKSNDTFQFLPCTSATLPPPLEDPEHSKTWAALFDPDPDHWSWGITTTHATIQSLAKNDPYTGRGVYLCGYLDVPLDYSNATDHRIVRLAVTKYQVSGLALADSPEAANSPAGRKSQRTLVVEPGGPGGSGTSFVWRAAEKQTQRFSSGQFDVLGWDPRGVNTSLPAMSCFPFDADRDRWTLLTTQTRLAVAGSPRAQLELADAMNDATFAACQEVLGDLPRFMTTALVARDLEQIRVALQEPSLTGYFVSYGTGIGQTYANMYPDRIGRLVMDGTEYVRDHRLLGGFGWTALDNATDAWHDGFLGECVAAGPEHCALAQPQEDGDPITVSSLQTRISALLESLARRPMPAYTASSGPSLITYSSSIMAIYGALYSPTTWPIVAQTLYDLEQGNSTLASLLLDNTEWEFKPPARCPTATTPNKPSSDELGMLVICADAYDAHQPPFTSHDNDTDGLKWWSSLWTNMTAQSWVSGDSRFYNVFPCRHYTRYFGAAAEVYRGDLNATLAHPVLLIAETHDPATPLRNGRRLLAEMGDNARLVVHHGYGHASGDTSACTDGIARAYILHGSVPADRETACFADEKPYRYAGATAAAGRGSSTGAELEMWRQHVREMRSTRPRVMMGL